MSFPVLVSTIDTDLRDKAQIDGDDILFMDNKGESEQLYHEIESFDSSTGELVAWVNIPALSTAIDIVFYIYYGNPDCSTQEFPEMVWDSNYMGVWHLDEGGTGTRFDCTSLSNDGITRNYDGDESKSGKVNYGDDLDGINDFIDVDTISDDIDDNTKGTIAVWIRPDSSPINDQTIFDSDHSTDDDPHILMRYYFVDSNWRIRIWCRNFVRTTKWDYYGSTNIVSDGSTWTYVVLVHDGTEPKLYVDGSLESLTKLTGNDDTVWFDGLGGRVNTVQIGAHWNAGGSHYGEFWKGMIDEVRVSNTDRSDAWISTSYNTMNTPSSFLSFGAEEKPKQKAYNNILLLQLLERFPNLFAILRYILGLQ